MISFPFVQASSERDSFRMALACGVAVALLGFAAEPFQEGAASSSGVAHEALFRLEVDLGCLPGGKALFRASWDFPEELRKL